MRSDISRLIDLTIRGLNKDPHTSLACMPRMTG